MTTNLSPEFLAAQRRYREAPTPGDKLAALKEMLSTIPKHKGTERMRVDLKARLSKLQQQLERQRSKRTVRSSPYEHIERHGAGQFALVGLPNCGKSRLLSSLSAAPEVADYLFSTFTPTVGMMAFEDIQIQLIDLPPLSDFTEGWVYGLIRQADAIALLVDLSASDPEAELLEALALLEGAHIQLVDHLPEEHPSGGTVKRALLLGSKSDLPGAPERLRFLQDSYGDQLLLIAVSAEQRSSLEALRRALFNRLEIVRVYTKKPGEPLSREHPYTLPRGSTVLQVAKQVHYKLAEKLDYARLWGSAQYEGQRVERDYLVKDGDLLELHG